MDNWQSAWVESNGINIHYHRTGGPYPVLLLIHGFTDNGLCWSRVDRQLETDYGRFAIFFRFITSIFMVF